MRRGLCITRDQSEIDFMLVQIRWHVIIGWKLTWLTGAVQSCSVLTELYPPQCTCVTCLTFSTHCDRSVKAVFWIYSIPSTCATHSGICETEILRDPMIQYPLNMPMSWRIPYSAQVTGRSADIYGRLLHNPSLVAIGLSVGHETWPPIRAFVIGWSKYKL